MKTNEEIIANLKAAKGIMQTLGRCTGELQEGKGGPVCLLGSLGVAVLGDQFDPDVYTPYKKGQEAHEEVEALLQYLPDEYLDEIRDDYLRYGNPADEFTLCDDTLVEFNDGFAGLDSGKVYDLFDRTIAGLEAKVAA